MNGVVYLHTRKTEGIVFYVGIGNAKRPFLKKSRNSFWHSTVLKHGYDIHIINSNVSWEVACAIEKALIYYYRSEAHGSKLTNLTDGGDGVLGFKMSEETKKKLSIINTGKKYSKDHCEKLSKALKGIPKSKEHIVKCGLAKKGNKFNLGKRMSDETKLKIGAFHKGNTWALGMTMPVAAIAKSAGKRRGAKRTPEQLENISKGVLARDYKHTEEHKEKVRQKMIGRTFSEESIEKMKQAQKGRFVSEECKDKLRQANLGKKASDETKAKMREAHAKRQALKY